MFIGQCLPIYAFYTILFIDRGKSVTDVAILIALWSAFSIVFEIPSGILADRWNRRNMLAIGSLLKGLCFVIWFFSYTFFMFALGFVFWAIAGAFKSGTEESLIYDNLKSDRCENRFTEIYGKAQFYANIGTIVGIISAGIISNFINIATISLLSAAICFLNIIFAMQIREKNFYLEHVGGARASILETFKKAGSLIKRSKVALVAILFLMLFASLGGYLDEFDALIINDFELNIVWISVIMTVRFGFIALGDILAPIVGKRLSSIKHMFLLGALACVFLVAFAVVWNIYAILLLGLAFMVMAVVDVLLVNVVQNEINEEGRATVMSFYGVGQNIGMICFALVFAMLAGWFSLQWVYVIVSLYGIVGSLVFWMLGRYAK